MSWIYDLNPFLIFEYNPVGTLSIVSFIAVVYSTVIASVAAIMANLNDYMQRVLQYYRDSNIGDVPRLQSGNADPEYAVRKAVWVDLLKMEPLPTELPDIVKAYFDVYVKRPLLFEIAFGTTIVALVLIIVACLEEYLKRAMLTGFAVNATSEAITFFMNVPILMLIVSIAATNLVFREALRATQLVESVFEILNYYHFVTNREVESKLSAKKKPSKKNIAEAYNKFRGMLCLTKPSDSQRKLMRETK